MLYLIDWKYLQKYIKSPKIVNKSIYYSAKFKPISNISLDIHCYYLSLIKCFSLKSGELLICLFDIRALIHKYSCIWYKTMHGWWCLTVLLVVCRDIPEKQEYTLSHWHSTYSEHNNWHIIITTRTYLWHQPQDSITGYQHSGTPYFLNWQPVRNKTK